MSTKTLSVMEKADKLVEDYIKVPENIQFYINAANFDLYNGPRGIRSDDKYEWRGFINACNIIREWFDKNDDNLWVDMDCESVSDKEPEGYTDKETGEYYEPNLANIYLYERADIKEVLFGKELKGYI